MVSTMTNKYLTKLAVLIEIGSDGKPKFVSDPYGEARALSAKEVNPKAIFGQLGPRQRRTIPQRKGVVRTIRPNRVMRKVLAASTTAGSLGYLLGKRQREKKAGFLTPEHKKEIAQTGVLVGSGVGAAALLDRFIKPRMNFSGARGKAKYIGLIGGANLAADYGAVKINKAIEHSRSE